MPRKYRPKTDRKNGKSKPQSLPATFKAGFLAALDGRTDLSRALRHNYGEIVEDIGGSVEVGHVKSALIERFVWLEAILQTLEHEMANGQLDKSEALGKWIQAVNSLSGLAKVLGVERRASGRPWLAAPVSISDGTTPDEDERRDRPSLPVSQVEVPVSTRKNADALESDATPQRVEAEA